MAIDNKEAARIEEKMASSGDTIRLEGMVCCHDVPEHNPNGCDGPTIFANLWPGCHRCNTNMQRQRMFDWSVKRYGQRLGNLGQTHSDLVALHYHAVKSSETWFDAWQTAGTPALCPVDAGAPTAAQDKHHRIFDITQYPTSTATAAAPKPKRRRKETRLDRLDRESNSFWSTKTLCLRPDKSVPGSGS